MKLEKFKVEVDLQLKDSTNVEEFLDKAFEYLCDFKSFPEYMESVTKITEESSEDNIFYHTWDVMIEDAQFQWKQRTDFERKNRHVKFELVEGDFEHMEGAWSVIDNEGQYKLQLELNFAIGLPVIEDVLGPVLRDKLQSNTHTMLKNLKERLESSQ